MSYIIRYATICQKGLVREKNQDNFWCMNEFLALENEGADSAINGMTKNDIIPAFAVFDGMGGEQAGEVASHIAASVFDAFYNENTKKQIKTFILDACEQMNLAICDYVKKNELQTSGSTVAILIFGKTEIIACNIGDSRIYQFSNQKLTQISYDHSEMSVTHRKAPLTQSLGIPKSEFIIEPYLAKGLYTSGDRYLICSDGLTDMVTDEQIEKIMNENPDISQCAEILLQHALANGGHDNITIIICEVRRQRRLFNRRGE